MAILKRDDGTNRLGVECGEFRRETSRKYSSMSARGPICSTFDPLNRPDRSVWRDPGTKDLEPRGL